MANRVASRGSDQFNLRFPEGLRERIREAAEASGRSMNTEIISRLEDSFDIAANDDLRFRLAETKERAQQLALKVRALEEKTSAEKARPAPASIPADFVSVIEELRASQQRIEALATWQLFDQISEKFAELHPDPEKKEEFAAFLEGVPYFEGIGKHPEIVARRLHQAVEREKRREKIDAASGSLTKRLAEEEAAAAKAQEAEDPKPTPAKKRKLILKKPDGTIVGGSDVKPTAFTIGRVRLKPKGT